MSRRSHLNQTILPVLSEFSKRKILDENYLLRKEDFSKSFPRTKTLCTIGPTSTSPSVLSGLLDVGMAIARFNLSHCDYEETELHIKNLRDIAKKKNKLCSVMVDTRGCAIRTTKALDGKVSLEKGDEIDIKFGDMDGDMCTRSEIYINDISVLDMIDVGDKIRIGYGMITLEVKSVTYESVKAVAINSGSFTSYKTVFLPKGKMRPAGKLRSQELDDIYFAVKVGADFLAASYISSAFEVRQIKHLLQEKGANHTRVIAKIECEQALMNFDDILCESDGIFISRGNLGEEIDLEVVTLAQKLCARKANAAGKPIIIATQMLESMRLNPFPTRAEASDVGNAVFDGADCLSMSGETAEGAYPVKATKTLSTICKESERSVNHRETFRFICDHSFNVSGSLDLDEAVASSAVKMSFDIKAALLIVFSSTGKGATLLSKYRPSCPIVLLTNSEVVATQSMVYRNVVPFIVSGASGSEEISNEFVSRAIKDAIKDIREKGFTSSKKKAIVLNLAKNQINVIDVV